MSAPILALTPGEPAGIGPDITIEQALLFSPHYHLVLFADPDLLQARARQLGKTLSLQKINSCDINPSALSAIQQQQKVAVVPVTTAAVTEAGHLNPANAAYVLETLRQATQTCLKQQCQALVTGPVHKGLINQAGFTFSGHTEFLAELSNSKQVVMVLATEGLRVALATTHLPLREVADAITSQRLQQILDVLHRDGQHYFSGTRPPRIYVCGLNPHAGDDGALGKEEQEIIEPTLQHLRNDGFDLVGPLSADTIFSPHNMHDADFFLAMFHDQGLPVLKFKGFSKAINITLGLNFIRTSVDHGTALTLAGTGQAKSDSLALALEQACHMSQIAALNAG